MLTTKRNGSGGSFLSGLSPRRPGEPAEAGSMKQLSQILRQARERKNVSLQEVARLTHLPLNSLQLLEGAGDARLVADSMYLIASLRSYAAFLNMDQGAALTQFIAELEKVPPVEEQAGGSTRPTQWLRPLSQLRSWALPSTLLLLLGLGLLALIGHYSELTQEQRPKEEKVAPPPLPSNSPPAPESWTSPPASSPARPASPTDAGRSEPFPPSPAVSPPGAAVPQTKPSAASAPQVKSPVVDSPPQPQQSPGSAPHRLRVQAKAKTWLHVTIDDQPLKRLFLHSGQSLEWSAERGFTLSLGNAGGVKLIMDGQELPPVGKAGQMVLNVRLPSHR